MDRCPKCDGMMLPMKTKKTVLPETEKKQGLKCSRCGFYQEKQQVFLAGRSQRPDIYDDSGLKRASS